VTSLNRILAVILAVFCLSALLFAQGGATGAISGTVRDANGGAMVDAKVGIISRATGLVVRELKTDTAGEFIAQLLPVGVYSVEVTAAGFAPMKFEGVEVRITETTRMNAKMQIAAVKEVVEVQSEAVPIDTSDASLGESISEVTVTSLPLATRNFQQLLDLSAGATANVNNAAALGRGDVRIDVNGGREDNNNYLIEGISVADYSFGELTYTPVPNPDDIQEFKVATSLYDASQGRNGGGNINAILKSGTSSYHGDAWEYLRNSKLDASDYFLGPFALQQNIFGGDFGGPVGSKAQLGYFYVNYQGTRQKSGDSLGTYINTEIPYVPASARTSPAALLTAFQGQGVTNIDPVAFALLNAKSNQFGPSAGGYFFPLVNAPAGTPVGALVPFKVSDPGTYNDDQFTANWDREFNHSKDRLSERFFWSDSSTYQPFGADNLQVQTGYPASAANLNTPLSIPLRGRFGSIAETHTFNTALINEFRFGVNIISDALLNVPVPGITAAALGISNTSGATDPYRFQFGSWQIGSFPNQPQSALSDSYTWLDTLSWTHGKHSLRFGGEIDRTSIRRELPVLDSGLLYFTPGSGNITDFDNFLMGNPAFGELGGGAANHDYHIPGFGVFAQDDFRVSQTLTLNLGLRTEWVGAASDSLCHLGNTIPQNSTTTGLAFEYPSCVSQYNIPGFSGTLNSGALTNEYSTVLEPRIGFAYDVLGKQTTVIHAGYGIYSVREDIGGVDNLAFSAPIYPVLVAPGSAGNMATFLSGAPQLGQVNGNFLPTPSFFQGFSTDGSCSPASMTANTADAACFSGTGINYIGLQVPTHWIVPTTQQWNLSVQRQLGGNWTLELGYVGTKGTHLRSVSDPDQATLASTSNPVTVNCGNIAANIPCNIPGTATGTPITITQSTIANANARAPYLGISPAAFEAFLPDSDSHYNALQATVSHRFSKGLYFQSAYTWSKSIDDVSTSSVAFLTRYNNQDSGAPSRGLSDFDHRHRLTTSFNYDLPALSGSGNLVKYALGNWETGSVILVQSGAPITIADSTGATAYDPSSFPIATANFAPGYNCSNALTTGSMSTKIANWVNPNAFAPATVVGSDGVATGFGDSPRNCMTGPGQWNVDYTLSKVFKLTEHQSLRFRTDFFNLFNHPSFANPSPLGTANYAACGQPLGQCAGTSLGQITQTVGTPRLVQFSLKYMF
jgi:hypothetical protein